MKYLAILLMCTQISGCFVTAHGVIQVPVVIETYSAPRYYMPPPRYVTPPPRYYYQRPPKNPHHFPHY